MEDMEAIRQAIFEKVRRRMGELETARVNEGNTDRFDKVLVLWIDLTQALHAKCTAGEYAPWASMQREVREIWERLTVPEHALTLECLYYQLPEGPQLELARKALQTARQRKSQQRQKAA